MEIACHNQSRHTPFEKRLKWIEMNSSKPYIKTGLYTDDGKWHVEADVFVVSAGENSMVYAIQEQPNGMLFGPVYFHTYFARIGYGNTNAAVDNAYNAAINRWNHFDVTLEPGSQRLKINDDFDKIAVWAYDYSKTPGHIVIGRRYYSVIYPAASGTKFGKIKFWHNGKLVRDFIPVLTKTGVGAMFDLVEWKMYEDETGNGFVPGEEKI